jgi:hypothetical protein
MHRRAYEIIATSGEDFVEPKTFEEATSRKTRLQAEIEALQAELADKDQRDERGHRLDLETYNRWRTNRIHVLHAKQQELRGVKGWISTKNGGTKPSEWALLARAYRFIDGIEELPADKTAEAEQLLDAIEFVLPGSFLQGREAPTGTG